MRSTPCLLVAAALHLIAPASAQLGSIVARARCNVLRDSFEDPIVSPGLRSDHLHTVFGATSFDEDVAPQDLAPGVESTCSLAMDRSMYWNPSLMYLRRPLPAALTVYLSIPTRDAIRPFPLGLRVIADSAHHRRWFCIADKMGGKREKQVPTPGFPGRRSAGGNPCIRWQVRQRFPPCWDGRHLDSEDHRSHMAYTVDRRCPDSHPVALPELRYIATFKVPEYTGGLRLSNDRGDNEEGLDMHFDVISGWDEGALAGVLQSAASSGEGGERRPRGA